MQVIKTELRVNQSLQMVQQGGGFSIHEIARRCGYSDPYYLSRLVRQHLGKTVRDMRRIQQHEPANPPR